MIYIHTVVGILIFHVPTLYTSLVTRNQFPKNIFFEIFFNIFNYFLDFLMTMTIFNQKIHQIKA